MEDESDERLYRIIRTVVRTHLRTYPGQRLGEHDEADLTQAIFLRFVDDERAQLSKFVRGRGSFAGFVAMKTRFWLRTIGRKLRHRDELARFESMGDEDHEDIARRDIAETVDMRRRLFAVADCVRGRVSSPEDKRAADLLFRALATDEELREALGLEKDALYRLKNRLRRHARACLEALFPEALE